MLHIEKILDETRKIFIRTTERLDQVKPGETTPGVALCAEIAAEFGMKGTVLYPILKQLFVGYPGFEKKNGRFGGMRRFLPGEKEAKAAAAEATEATDETEEETSAA